MGNRASANRGERSSNPPRPASQNSQAVPPLPAASQPNNPEMNQSNQPRPENNQQQQPPPPNNAQPENNPNSLHEESPLQNPINQLNRSQENARNSEQRPDPSKRRKSIKEEDDERLLNEAHEAVDAFQVTDGIFRTLSTFLAPTKGGESPGKEGEAFKVNQIKTIAFDLSKLEAFEESLDYTTVEQKQLIPIKTEEEVPEDWLVDHLILGKYQVIQELHTPAKTEDPAKCPSLLKTYRLFNYHILSEVIAKKLPVYEEREAGESGMLRQNAFKMICAMWKKLSEHPSILNVLYLERIKNSIVVFLEFIPSINLQGKQTPQRKERESQTG